MRKVIGFSIIFCLLTHQGLASETYTKEKLQENINKVEKATQLAFSGEDGLVGNFGTQGSGVIFVITETTDGQGQLLKSSIWLDEKSLPSEEARKVSDYRVWGSYNAETNTYKIVKLRPLSICEDINASTVPTLKQVLEGILTRNNLSCEHSSLVEEL